MALITRVSRLFKADFHAVLDRIEEPDVLLNQSIREMEADVGRDELRMKWLAQEASQIKQRGDDIAQRLERTEDELDVCFEADKQDLAKVTVRRKLECERRQKQLHMQYQVNEKEIHLLDERLQENRQQLEQLRQKAEVLLEDRRADYPSISADTALFQTDAVRDEDVEIAFLKEMQCRQPTQRRAS